MHLHNVLLMVMPADFSKTSRFLCSCRHDVPMIGSCYVFEAPDCQYVHRGQIVTIPEAVRIMEPYFRHDTPGDYELIDGLRRAQGLPSQDPSFQTVLGIDHWDTIGMWVRVTGEVTARPHVREEFIEPGESSLDSRTLDVWWFYIHATLIELEAIPQEEHEGES